MVSARTRRLDIARWPQQTVMSLADLLLPPHCVSCGVPPQRAGSRLCDSCEQAVATLRRQPACPVCAASVGPHSVSDGRCRQCRGRRRGVDGIVRAGPYRSILGRFLRAYKYAGRQEFEPLFSEWLTEVVQAAPWRNRVEAIVAVPPHWRRRLSRHTYPAEALAELLAERTGLLKLRLLRRTRAGPNQLGLSYTKRLENVRGAFAMRRGVRLRGARLLLVDDVRTTGATLAECAKVLRRAGAKEVYAAVAARVGFSDPRDVRDLTV